MNDRGSHPEDEMEELACSMEQKYKEMEIMSGKLPRMPKGGDSISEYRFSRRKEMNK